MASRTNPPFRMTSRTHSRRTTTRHLIRVSRVFSLAYLSEKAPLDLPQLARPASMPFTSGNYAPVISGPPTICATHPAYETDAIAASMEAPKRSTKSATSDLEIIQGGARRT